MRDRAAANIVGASFDEFVSFIFNTAVPDPPDENPKRDHWYYHLDVSFDPSEVLTHYTRLFNDPVFLRERYTRGQLEEGFWAIQSCNLDCGVGQVIWMTDVPFAVRERCVHSMFHLYERLFANDTLATAASMWWDSLCYDWHCGNRSRENGGEDERMQNVMFATLAKILELDSLFCQGAALHGLGHLHHPGTEELVADYLKAHPNISADMKEYARAAARFEVL